MSILKGGHCYKCGKYCSNSMRLSNHENKCENDLRGKIPQQTINSMEDLNELPIIGDVEQTIEDEICTSVDFTLTYTDEKGRIKAIKQPTLDGYEFEIIIKSIPC